MLAVVHCPLALQLADGVAPPSPSSRQARLTRVRCGCGIAVHRRLQLRRRGGCDCSAASPLTRCRASALARGRRASIRSSGKYEKRGATPRCATSSTTSSTTTRHRRHLLQDPRQLNGGRRRPRPAPPPCSIFEFAASPSRRLGAPRSTDRDGNSPLLLPWRMSKPSDAARGPPPLDEQLPTGSATADRPVPDSLPFPERVRQSRGTGRTGDGRRQWPLVKAAVGVSRAAMDKKDAVRASKVDPPPSPAVWAWCPRLAGARIKSSSRCSTTIR